jgi:hypothetical protein
MCTMTWAHIPRIINLNSRNFKLKYISKIKKERKIIFLKHVEFFHSEIKPKEEEGDEKILGVK